MYGWAFKGKCVPVNLNLDANCTLRVLQISDCHLERESSAELLGLNIEQSFRDVLNHIAANEDKPDLLLFTGDISGDYSMASYQRFYDIVSELLPDIPIACLPGNHDLASNMAQALPGRCLPKSLILGDWMVYMLDSSVEGCIHGDVQADELEWLQRSLSQNSGKHVLVYVHHQPVAIGCDWIDQYVIRSADQLLGVLDSHVGVKALSWGHVHQVFQARRDHYQLLSTPSTCIQFKPNSRDFKLDRKMPGYRVFELHGDGRLDTEVKRIEPRDYPIDYSSEGY